MNEHDLTVITSQPHYVDHLAPIVEALGDDLSVRWVARGRRGRGGRWRPGERIGAALVASSVDARWVRGRARRVIHVEHGAGQVYVDGDADATGSYSGGAGMDHVDLFLTPSETSASRWRARYPDAAAVAVGCPRLDRFGPVASGTTRRRRHGTPVVAFTWHWDCLLVPETRTALPAWRRDMAATVLGLTAEGVRFIGHGHPRLHGRRNVYADLPVEWVEHLDDVLDLADVLVADNTSALYEAAAVGLTTIVLNAPWYRRDVEHGLRFWSAPPGPMLDHPGELRFAIEHALLNPRWCADVRGRAVDAAYDGRVDAHASVRAAAAIVEAVR